MQTLPWINIRENRSVCWSWDNLSLSLFVYKTVGSGQADEITKFIIAFKSSDDDECLKAAMVEIYEAAGEYTKGWKQEYNCRYVVPVPSSRAHEISRYSKAVCGFIARIFHLQYREGLLFREWTVHSSHVAAFGNA